MLSVTFFCILLFNSSKTLTPASALGLAVVGRLGSLTAPVALLGGVSTVSARPHQNTRHTTMQHRLVPVYMDSTPMHVPLTCMIVLMYSEVEIALVG